MKTINLMKFTNKNYPGVLYQNGKAVATDGYTLVAVNQDYDPSVEGKFIGKGGVDAPGNNRLNILRKWANVIPDTKGWNKLYLEDVPDAIFKEAREHKKLHGKESLARVIINDNWYDLWQLEKIMQLVKNQPDVVIYCRKKRPEIYDSVILTIKSKEVTAVLMYVFPTEEENITETMFIKKIA